MPDRSAIEWTDATWNPTTGCTRVSAGCDHCYAEELSRRLLATTYCARLPVVDTSANRRDPFAVRVWPERLRVPGSWRESRRVFVNSMSDLFHHEVPGGVRTGVLPGDAGGGSPCLSGADQASGEGCQVCEAACGPVCGGTSGAYLDRDFGGRSVGRLSGSASVDGAGCCEVPELRAADRAAGSECVHEGGGGVRRASLGDCGGGERDRRQVHGAWVGTGSAGSVPQGQGAVLLQAVGWADAEGGWAGAGWGDLGRVSGVRGDGVIDRGSDGGA